MNKYQALAALILQEVRAAELASFDAKEPEEAEALVVEKLEVFLRENLTEVTPDKPDDFLSMPDPSANLNLGDRWKWTPNP
jgi:hypothetical protein